MEYTFSDLTLTTDPETGRWVSLVGGKCPGNWLSNAEDSCCGLPFIGASALDRGCSIPVCYAQAEDGSLQAVSERGEVRVSVEAKGEGLAATVRLPDRRGPRSGWCLDLNHLDLPGDTVENQVMPVCMQTAEDLSWSMIVWQRGEADYLLTAFDGPFAGWYIRYSFAGHRMRGFDVYARADDVLVSGEGAATGRRPTVTELRVWFAAVESVDAGITLACEALGLVRVKPGQTCVVAGERLKFVVGVGAVSPVEWQKPDGTRTRLTAEANEVITQEPGVHCFTATSANGRGYTARVLALGDWQEMAERAIAFHRQQYQTDCGAFARCINGTSLKPDGFTFEGVPFGDPDAPQSCRTGEFGGFGAWSQIIHMQNFGPNETMLASVRRYFDWITNKGREEKPRPNTLCSTPHSYGGRDYGPLHLFEEQNYIQHEAWLMAQFVDAMEVGMTDLGDLFVRFCGHFLSEHVDENGVVWNQNTAVESKHDYCTVDAPILNMLKAGRKLLEMGEPLGTEMVARVRKGVAYLHRRGFSFATEGESCTEDGSMACTAWTLAGAYNELDDPDPAWLELAERMMDHHAKLEMRGDDIRIDGSSIRFWETQYETGDYGPSINASHGWTLWSALARWELFRATGEFEQLWQCWRHSVNVAHRLDARGAFPCCFTPDIIPSPPHGSGAGLSDAGKHESRMTSAFAGLGYPATLSMSGMHLFVTAPRMWYRTCGYDPKTGRLINARLEGDRLIPNTPVDCERIVRKPAADSCRSSIQKDLL